MDEFLLLDATGDFLLLDASGDSLLLGTDPVPVPETFFGIAAGGTHAVAGRSRREAKFVRPLRRKQIVVHDDEEIMAIIRKFLEVVDS